MVTYYPQQAQPKYMQPMQYPVPAYSTVYPSAINYNQAGHYQPVPAYQRPAMPTAPQITYVPVYSPSELLKTLPVVKDIAPVDVSVEKLPTLKKEAEATTKAVATIEADKTAENALARLIMQYAKTNPALKTFLTKDNIQQLEKSLTDPAASVHDLLDKFIKEPFKSELHAKGILGFFRRQSARTLLYSVKRFMNRIPMTQNYRDQLNVFFDDLKRSPDKITNNKSLSALGT